MLVAMNNADASLDVCLGRESSTALASALEKRSRRDVCRRVPYSLLCGSLAITSQITSAVNRIEASNETELSCGERERKWLRVEGI
jgi:hypothetical protein